jgi:hypothetical protein
MRFLGQEVVQASLGGLFRGNLLRVREREPAGLDLRAKMPQRSREFIVYQFLHRFVWVPFKPGADPYDFGI